MNRKTIQRTTTAVIVFAWALIMTIFEPACAGAATGDFPQKGKPITIIVPFSAGGTADITARLIAPVMEKELGTPVVVANKPGASSQLGATEAARAKPDGHTLLMYVFPGGLTVYMDPERQAVPEIRELQPLALHNIDAGAVLVHAGSPYTSLKHLVDAAKAKPGELKACTDGLMGADHMETLYFQKRAGVKFKLVHFAGGAPATTALAGGHVDLRVGKVGSGYAMIKAGKVRAIGVMDNQRSKFVPEVQTFEEQGYKDYTWYNATGVAVPKGTPRPIMDALSNAIKKSVETEEAQKKLEGVGLIGRFMGPEEYTAYKNEYEKIIEPLIREARMQ